MKEKKVGRIYYITKTSSFNQKYIKIFYASNVGFIKDLEEVQKKEGTDKVFFPESSVFFPFRTKGILRNWGFERLNGDTFTLNFEEEEEI